MRRLILLMILGALFCVEQMAVRPEVAYSQLKVAMVAEVKGQANRQDQLVAVSHWFYFLSIDLENDGPVYEQLTASIYDMVAMDPIFTEENSVDEADDVQALVTGLHNAAHPKLVIAYIDIGQAEDFRTYWQDGRGIGNPEWIVGADPDGWEGNYPVAYWYDGWRNIWLGESGYLQAILDTGFDRVYLDWGEAYSEWRSL